MENSGVKGEARKIVHFEEENCEAFLYNDILREIIESRPEIKTLPMIVVAIAGVVRSGKSFLLNLLASYLAYLEENGNEDGWMECSWTIQGVSWAKGEKSITHGIWIFSQPFTITRHDGSQAAVLLADSQGTGDNLRSAPEIDTLITYIGLKISSVQVLNVKEHLRTTELSAMELCTDYADIDGDAPYLHPSLLFLIRDFVSGETMGDDPNLFPDLISNNKNKKLRKTLEGIKKVFNDIGAYKMPYPGMDIAKATEGVWKVEEVPKDFLKCVSGLARKLFALEQPTGRQCPCWESGVELLKHFKEMKSHFENKDLPPLTNPSDALQAMVMQRAFDILRYDFGSRLAQISQSDELNSYKTIEEVEQFYDRLKNEAVENFKKAVKYRKYEGSEIACKYLKMLDDHFKLMSNELWNLFKFVKTVSELEKKCKQLARHIQQKKEEHTTVITNLTKEIDEYNQRLQNGDDGLQDVIASKTAEIERIEKGHKEDMKKDEKELAQWMENLGEAKQKLQEEKERLKKFYMQIAAAVSIGVIGTLSIPGLIGAAGVAGAAVTTEAAKYVGSKVVSVAIQTTMSYFENKCSRINE